MPASLRCSASASSSASSAAFLVVALCAAACSPSPAKITVGRIVLNASRELDGKTAERDALRAAVQERLDKATALSFERDASDTTHVLQLVIGDEIAPADAAPTRPMEVRLRPTHEGPEFVAVARPQVKKDLVTTLLAGFDDAWVVIDRMRRLDVAKDDKLVAALQEADPRLREFAIERAADRRAQAAVMPLCALLKNEKDPTLMLKAIGSLVAIGDVRAVEPLIALSHQKDTGFVLQVIFAVGSIGGRTAKAYLVTLASGHPDEEVQRAAKDALGEMSRRNSSANAHTPAPSGAGTP